MKLAFETIGVIGKNDNPKLKESLMALAGHLAAKNVRLLLDESSADSVAGSQWQLLDRKALIKEADLIVVIGGDGTFLDAARSIGEQAKPMLGINRGRLGFLVDILPEKMLPALDEILLGHYQKEDRFLLQGQVIRGGEQIYCSHALNDVVTNKRDVARMIEFSTYINGRYISNHRADGLIVATPTGSTAYALSSGGPVVQPWLEAMVLVPICPHTLSDRPVVVDSNSEIEIEISQRSSNPVQVTWDGQESLSLEPGDRLRVRRSPFNLNLIHPLDYDYFTILRNKLHWGGDHHLR